MITNIQIYSEICNKVSRLPSFEDYTEDAQKALNYISTFMSPVNCSGLEYIEVDYGDRSKRCDSDTSVTRLCYLL